MYKNAEMLEDKEFERMIREKFHVDSWMYQSLQIEVEMKKSQVKTIEKNKKELLEDLLDEYKEILKEAVDKDFKKGRKWRAHKFKVEKAIRNLEASIGRNITFGGRDLLQRITHLHNALSAARKVKDVVKIEWQINELTCEYHERRTLGLTIIGELGQKSNRKFDFDFLNRKVVFKPSMGVKIPITFFASTKQLRTLEKLQELVGEISLSVRLTEDFICISWDEEKVSGFAFNEREYKRERAMIQKGSPKEEFKSLKQKWYREQDSRKLVGKISGRTLSLDLNPENIGVAVTDKNQNCKLLYTEVIMLEGLNTALRLASTHKYQKKQNSKRSYEIDCAIKYIIKIALHFRCESITIEDLDFKQKGVNTAAKLANKKTKNIWHREQTMDLIDKYCKIYGIRKILVNPCYSSFIGNIKYLFYDPLNAACELGRRGLMQFEEAGFYPSLEKSDFDTMSRDFGLDVQGKDFSTWVEAFSAFKTAGLRYRRGLENCSEFEEINLSSHKSAVKRLHFYTK